MSQPAPQEECVAEGIRQRAKIRYPKGVIYPITVHGMKGAMEDLAATQLRAEQSENREEVLQLEFIDMRNRAKLAEKSALDLKAIADHLQRQRAADNDAHGKDIAELQQQIAGLQKALATSEERRQRLVKAFENLEPLPAAQQQIAELTQQRDRLSKTLDALGYSGKLLAGGGEQDGDMPSGQSTNQPVTGKDAHIPYDEAQLDSLERDNDRLRAVIDGIKSSIDGIQTLVTLSE